MSGYQLDLLGTDGQATTETHEDAAFAEAGVYVRDGAKETVIPWHGIQVASITDLNPREVRRPDVRMIKRPATRRAP